MAIWPATLPGSILDADCTLTPADLTIRSDMEIGTARVRRRSAARNDQVEVSWIFTDAQMADFRSWFDNALQGGAAWFNGLSLATGDGGQIQPDLRFAGPFQAVPRTGGGGLYWKVTGRLDIFYV